MKRRVNDRLFGVSRWALICVGIVLLAGDIQANEEGSSFEVPWHAVTGGGVATDGTPNGMALSGTSGQFSAGVMSGGSYQLVGGFQALRSSGAGPNIADLDGNGVVNAADLAQLLGGWGDCAGPCTPNDGTPNAGCPADFNDDCMVNAADLAQLLGNWGP